MVLTQNIHNKNYGPNGKAKKGCQKKSLQGSIMAC